MVNNPPKKGLIPPPTDFVDNFHGPGLFLVLFLHLKSLGANSHRTKQFSLKLKIYQKCQSITISPHRWELLGTYPIFTMVMVI